MKQTWMKFALAAALATGLSVAQTQQQPTQQRNGEHRGRRGGMLDRLATRLNLTEAQKEQAKAEFQNAREQSQPLMAQLKETHQALADAVKTGKTEVEIDQIAGRQGDLMGELAAIRTKAMAKVYATLTPEQRAQADQLHSDVRGFMQHRFGRFGAKSNP
jgi:Spy/CpxP family protein refolding chaperone